MTKKSSIIPQIRLMGIRDSRGLQGVMARGANVYQAGSSSAHGGRPTKQSIQRRLKGVK
jgi:hypothetical protein